MAKTFQIDPRPDNKWWKDQFRTKANSPESWFMMARTLERAARRVGLLFVSDLRDGGGERMFFHCGDPFYLLAGFTIKNILKGLVVQKEPALNTKHEFRVKTHKLLDLADRAQLDLTESEKQFLAKLEVFIEWAGRYPVPLDYEASMPRTLPNGGFATLQDGSTSDFERWKSLVNRLQQKYFPAHLRPGCSGWRTKSK